MNREHSDQAQITRFTIRTCSDHSAEISAQSSAEQNLINTASPNALRKGWVFKKIRILKPFLKEKKLDNVFLEKIIGT